MSTAQVVGLPAFPGAEGFGSSTPGGRGGQVFVVTNLNNSGPGSFREACEAAVPRVVVFAVGGEILLSRAIIVLNPYITIAGQTAPGGGITIRNDGTSEEDTLIFQTHDVIIRYIRSRPGPSDDETTGCDALSFETGTYNAIADHCSLSWDVDETFELWPDPHDITLQWSIVSESLHCSSHTLGCHSKGVLLGTEGAHNISVHHCLLAHHDERNPRVGNSGLVDFVNNVVYNPDAMCHLTNQFCTQPINYVGNYVKRGPDSKLIGPDGRERYEIFAWDTGLGFSIYVQGNIGPHRPDHTYPEDVVVDTDDRFWVTSTRHNAPSVTTYDAFEAYDRVLGEAGTIRPYRDPVDSRIVTEVIDGTGHIIDDPSEVGGYPTLPPGTPRTDTDGDGMPDDWETSHNLNPNDPADASGDRDGDGYTNVEEWFNGLVDCGTTDTDGDHVRDLCDNCPTMANIDQLDTDVDGIGNVCDADDDGDTVPDASDNCPLVANTNQEDNDQDGTGNVCDTCTDADGDGLGNGDNGNTTCPAGTDIDCDDAGSNATDPDLDNICDPTDNCPTIANADQADLDGDHIGDVCDDDVDGDGIDNADDNCPLATNTNQTDGDADGVGDVCDACPNTAPGIPVTETGCPVVQVGPDLDGDGDVDHEDFGRFQVCLTGSSVPIDDPGCLNANLDGDIDVDQDDFVIFQGCMSGANVPPADPICGD
ncbi:MAG: thrombospondin type 3 repeat-containing protein [Planctomycetota bacterium]